MCQTRFRELISGRRRGLPTAVLRLFLYVLSLVYGAIIWLRNQLYDKGILSTHKVAVPVISVGNITTGGTGKTPLVIWLIKRISKSYKCAVLTRGYKRKQLGLADEPAIITQSCPKIPVIVNPDRVAGANEAIQKLGAEVLIMDDAFQHRRVRRDLDIVTIDASLPFGYGKILPAGLLREPPSSLRRASIVIITRADQVTEAQLDKIESRIKGINPNIVAATAIHKPTTAITSAGIEIPIDQLRGKKVFAFCGLGNPGAFFKTLEHLQVDLIGSQIYDDHHYYTSADISHICERAAAVGSALVLTTQKDWVKISKFRPSQSNLSLAYLVVEIEFISGQDQISRLIKEALAGKITKD